MEVLVVDFKKMEEKEKEALHVLKQDLSKWLNTVIKTHITPESFLTSLDTGVVLCQLATRIQTAAAATLAASKATPPLLKRATTSFKAATGAAKRPDLPKPISDICKLVPMMELHCNTSASKGSFQARDNTANFIAWCRDLGLKESVLFESEGLVLHRDEKRVILTLLAVARVGGDLGLATPRLVEMEKEIEKEEKEEVKKVVVSRGDNEILNILHQCSCSCKLHAVLQGPGKFHITMPSGRTMTVYIRVLHNQVMVRVGGGWDTLDHLLLKYDPCRMSNPSSLSKDIISKRTASTCKRGSVHLGTSSRLAPLRIRQPSPSPSRSLGRATGESGGLRKWESTPSLYSRQKKKT